MGAGVRQAENSADQSRTTWWRCRGVPGVLRLLALLVTACGAPVEVTSACKVSTDCPNGFVCQSGICTDPNQFGCSTGDHAFCEGLRVAGQWKTGELTSCQSAQCVANTCQVVNAATNSVCDDGDGLACTLGACSAEATCVAAASLAADTCLIEGVCVAAGSPKGTAEADACLRCDPTQSTTAWRPREAGSSCTSDGVSCTQDLCNDIGQCTHTTLLPDSCRIDGACVQKGALQPGSPCNACQPDQSGTSWTALAKGSACPDDGIACSVDSCDGSGTCRHDAVTADSCLIGGTCVTKDATEPGNPCRSCQPDVAAKAWSPLAAGATCTADDLPCTIDACNGEGSCTADALQPETCLVQQGGKARCMAAGERDSDGNNCKACVPSVSTSQLSDAVDGAACVAGVWCLVGQCQSGSCKSDGPKSGTCYLPGSSSCAEAGTLNPGNACERCEPGANPLAWTAISAGTPCPADSVGCTTDACNGAGSCLHTADSTACDGLDGPCAQGTCDVMLGCVSMPLSATVACDSDGVACVVERCDGKGQCNPPGSGVADNALCDDGVGCTVDACTSGGCSHTPQNGTCDDGNACTQDTCDLASDCTYTNLSGTLCTSDDLACTTETCAGGSCSLSIDASSCVLDGACVAVGTAQQGGCQVCTPAASQEQWTLLADQSPCATDDIACTLDLCNGGACQHQASDALCDDGTSCTADVCDAQSGCSNTDACPWGHVCNGALQACVSDFAGPVVLAASGSADPNPTNAVLARHTTAGGERTWALWQSQSCMTVSGGGWVVSEPARLRALALDPQVASPQNKQAPAVWTLPVSEQFGGADGVCQAWPTITADPEDDSRLWLSWLEAKPGATGSCLASSGQGGLLRFARLDSASGPAFATVSGVCPGTAANGPLFLTQGLGVLDGSGPLSDPAALEAIAVRPLGADLSNFIPGVGLRGIGGLSVTATLNSLAPLAAGPVALVPYPSGSSGEPWIALGASNDEGTWTLWAHGVKTTGAKGTLATWIGDLSQQPVISGASAICSVDAVVDDEGALGVAVVVRRNGLDEVALMQRSLAGQLDVTIRKSQASLGDCRVGIAAARIAAAPGGFAVTAYVTPLAITPFAASLQSAGPVEVPVVTVPDAALSTTDNGAAGGPTFALGWRGLTRPQFGPGGTVTVLQEVLTTTESRKLLLFTGTAND